MADLPLPLARFHSNNFHSQSKGWLLQLFQKNEYNFFVGNLNCCPEKTKIQPEKKP